VRAFDFLFSAVSVIVRPFDLIRLAQEIQSPLEECIIVGVALFLHITLTCFPFLTGSLDGVSAFSFQLERFDDGDIVTVSVSFRPEFLFSQPSFLPPAQIWPSFFSPFSFSDPATKRFFASFVFSSSGD